MIKLLTIYPVTSPRSQQVIEDLLEDQDIPFTVEAAPLSDVMKLSKGKLNPQRGFLVLGNEGEVLLTLRDLVNYIEQQALWPL